jgi:golgi phosphoprotein 3
MDVNLKNLSSIQQTLQKAGQSLTIAEQLFMLSICEEKGKVLASIQGHLGYGLTAAILGELALLGCICLENGKNRDRIRIANKIFTENEVLDDALEKIAASAKPHKVRYWLHDLGADRKGLQDRLARSLKTKGILKIEKKRYLWVIPYTRFSHLDVSAKYWVKEHLRVVVLADVPANQQTILLLSLLKSCDLDSLVFTRDERYAAGSRIRKLVSGELFGETISLMIQEVETAAMLAMMNR